MIASAKLSLIREAILILRICPARLSKNMNGEILCQELKALPLPKVRLYRSSSVERGAVPPVEAV